MSARGATHASALGSPIDHAPSGASAQPDREQGPSTRKSLAYVYAGYAFRYLYLLVLIPFYGRVLGADAYGKVLAAVSLGQIVWLLCEYAFPVTGARDAAATSDRRRLATIYGQQLSGRLWMALPALAVGLAGTMISPLLRAEPWFGVLGTLIGLASAMNLGWFFQGTQRFGTSVMLEVAGFGISLVLVLTLVSSPEDAWLVLAAGVIAGITCSSAAHWIALRSLRGQPIHARGGVQLVRDSSALFVHNGAGMISAQSSTYLLSLFATATQVGWYGAAERLAVVALSLMHPANQVLVARVTRHLSHERTEPSAYKLIRRALLLMTGFGAALLCGTLLFAHMIVPWILGEQFLEATSLLCALAFMFPFAAATHVLANYAFIPLRLDRIVWRISLLTALASVTTTVVLCQTMGELGAAVARCAGPVLAASAFLFVANRLGLLARIWHA